MGRWWLAGALAAACLALLVAVFWMSGEKGVEETEDVPHPAADFAKPIPSAGADQKRGGGEAVMSAEASRLVENAWIGLVEAGGADAEKARRILAELLEGLDREPIGAAAAAIVGFLRSGRDAATGLEFEVGEGGVLEGAPSLRVALLDALGRIDPLAAAEYSREMLPGVSKGAESSVALRNLDWGGRSEDAGLFREATLRHVSNAEWAASPDAGYLEGYDAAVRLGDPVIVGVLAQRIQEDPSGAVANAALLALERLAGSGNAEVLGSIAAEERLDSARAGELMARADVADPEQRAVVEAFLESPVEGAVRESFFKAFPLASHSMGPRLMTEETPMDADERMAADGAALEVVEEWLRDSRFGNSTQELEKVAERLREY